MEYRLAKLQDIDRVLDLQDKYHIETIADDDLSDGFVTTRFTRNNLEELIIHEKGLVVAVEESRLVAYVMVASWQYWSVWPFFRFMINDLDTLMYKEEKVDTNNSYQYGPICIDKSVRGTGVLEGIFDFAYKHMEKSYPLLVTFINQTNQRSYEAHVRKLGLEVIKEFTYKNNQYYELIYDGSDKST